MLSFSCLAEPKVIHVLVALCDNKYQKIVPVPQAIGNGQDPKNNLYWGAAYGFKTYSKVIHVLVALCDNKYQKIVPVPQAIGNGQDPHSCISRLM